MASLHLPFVEARDLSPCDSCASTPCCTTLPLIRVQPRTAVELDHLHYVAGFANIELGLQDNGEWQVFYRQPCRFLAAGRCSVHGSDEQPHHCRNYNPYSCWYKPIFDGPVQVRGYTRVDFRRMQYLRQLVVVNREDGRLVRWPQAADLEVPFSQAPLEPVLPADANPMREEWRAWLRDAGHSLPLAHETTGEDPCGGCAAWCCKTLTFPLPVPSTARDLDYMRYCLGFPGIEIGIADGRWVIVVRTTCRHLQDSRCSLYGNPERPLLCNSYDARNCTYVVEFGTPRPPDFLRLSLEEFELLAESIEFDEYGNILVGAAVTPLRRFVEERLRVALMPKRFVVSSAPGAMHREVAACVDEALRSLGLESQLGEAAEGTQQIAVGLGALPAAGANAILFNLDPLRDAIDVGGRRVWDYSSLNVDLWRHQGVSAQWLPFGFVPRLARMGEATGELDVACFGSLTQRRRLLLDTLRSRGFRVEVLPSARAFDDPRVAQAKILLMLSSLEAHFDSILATYLLANGRFVIAERTSDPDQERYLPGLVIVAADRILESCVHHLEHAGERRQIAERGFDRVRALSLAEGLRNLLRL